MARRPALPALVLLAALLAGAAAPGAARALLEDAAPKPGSGLTALSNALQQAAQSQRARAAELAKPAAAAAAAADKRAAAGPPSVQPRQAVGPGVGVSPEEITFTFTFNPKLNLDPSLGLTPLSLSPSGTLSAGGLALTLERALAASSVLSPRAALASEGALTLPGTSLTVEGGENSKTVKAPSNSITVEQPKAEAAAGPASLLPLPPLVQLLSNLRPGVMAKPASP
ncbi:hypothetical protein Rsub_09004 [Raphidocelis subcapitata]|uniref:Uncharacterized protein n=1 Tax=Raphidocelis subcapitata TaxID=307507 RepID=A0A2V0PAP1_9CHLO|nr:hypothetical protein Rsub_09004 [Raphidocelis subcapitata]|eukprot:GBF96924.1 hypothetical protein Rsub_09004 [Raphidocelis subcapitata]